MDDLIKQGADAFRAGNRDEARKFLITAVKQNPENERAWGWLYNVTNNDKERIDCLKQILRINPNNEKANQLYNKLTGRQSQLENRQPQDSKQISQPVKKSSKSSLIFIGALASIFICVCGFFILSPFLISSKEKTARILPAEDVFEVSAVDLVEMEGYTVTSAVCEVVSSEHFLPLVDITGGQIVFHAFRITGTTLNSEVVLLFGSNHTAEDGSGLVWPVNAEAVRLFPDFPDGSKLSYPITINTAGAPAALDCAHQAGKPLPLKLENIDVEAWRRKVIEKFGPEQTLSDGSKDDYVRYAFGICKYKESNPSMTYEEGSFQQYVLDTFCPYVK